MIKRDKDILGTHKTLDLISSTILFLVEIIKEHKDRWSFCPLSLILVYVSIFPNPWSFLKLAVFGILILPLPPA